MAPFDKGLEYVNQMPTALLISGFHGNEIVGT